MEADMMTKGWAFARGEFRYWVGAADATTAQQYLSKHDAEAAKSDPTPIPEAVAKFFELADKTIVSGRVFNG
jgi:hypothetical protein